MKKFKAFVVAMMAMFCFAAGVQAQKVSMTVADQYYAAQDSYYKMIVVALVAVYAVYLAFHHYRRKELNRFMGKAE